jgi:hypothetical protein
MQTTVQTVMPPDLYLPCILLQRSSTELLVYSPHVHQVVIIAWYVSAGHNNSSPLKSEMPGQQKVMVTHVFLPSEFESGSAGMAFSGAVFVPSSLASLFHARSYIAKMGL